MSNFKAFGPMQSVPIKPLTLIFGANSSGKSSILHSLLLLRNAIDTGEYRCSPCFDWWGICYLGGFRQFVFKRNPENAVLLTVTLDANDLALSLDAMRSKEWKNIGQSNVWKTAFESVNKVELTIVLGVRVDDLGKPISGEMARPLAFEYAIDGNPFMKFSRSTEKEMRMTFFDSGSNIGAQITSAIIDVATSTSIKDEEDARILRQMIDDLVSNQKTLSDKAIPEGLIIQRNDSSTSQSISFISIPERNEQMKKTLENAFPYTINEFNPRLPSYVSYAAKGNAVFRAASFISTTSSCICKNERH